MKSLTLSCLMCALNLIFAQELLRKAKNFLEVADTSNSCSKSQKLPKCYRTQSGQAYL